jgi:hypothetical protein
MREIKFRVFDTRSKKMITDEVCFQLALGLNGSIKAGISEDVLMQFTGLTDKNGVEIYEFDVDNKGRVCEYFPQLGSFGFKKPNYSAITFLGQFITSGCEIVGNKFENPELL